jgi:hypothetical protein
MDFKPLHQGLRVGCRSGGVVECWKAEKLKAENRSLPEAKGATLTSWNAET